MYYIYLYGINTNGSKQNQYGYWTGKSYSVNKKLFPICCSSVNDDHLCSLASQNVKKGYKSIQRAISSGRRAYERFYYVKAFDIRDEYDKIVYQSDPMFPKQQNTKNQKQSSCATENSTLQKTSTPELDKVVDMQVQIKLCHDFLTWLQYRYAMFDKKVPREAPFYRGGGDYLNVKAVVYEFLGIEQENINKDIDALLDGMRKKQEG